MRLRAIVIAIVAVLICGGWLPTVQAQSCDLFGLIKTNTTWSASICQRYVVTGNVTVDPGVTLTIAPGTVVAFNAERSLIVKGTLIARGTAASRIVFTSNLPTPERGDWGSIEFADTSPDATFDASGAYTGGSIIQYATVEYAGQVNNTAIKANRVAPFIDHNTIRNNAYSGMYVTYREGLRIRITDNLIEENGPPPTLLGIRGGGIRIDGGVNDVPNPTRALISRNVFRNNQAYDAGALYLAGGSAVVTDNIIEGNETTGLAGGIWANLASKSTISGNTIRNNTAGNAGGGMYASGPAEIIGNVITDNKALQGGGVAFVAGKTGAFSGNLLEDNTATNVGGGLYLVNSLRLSIIPIQNNSFINNTLDGQPSDLHNDNNANVDNIDASNNWWGTSDRSAIGARIFDNVDDTNLGVVDFEPFRTQSIAGQTPLSAGVGGQATSTDGAVEVQVPAGALPSDSTITIIKPGQPTNTLPPGSDSVQQVIITAVSTNGVPLTQFAQPITIKITYTDAELAALGIAEQSLTIAFWNGSSWVSLLPCAGCGIDTANNRVTVLVDHFSEFALISASYQVYLPVAKRSRP